MRCMVTGAAGFIGSHLTERLLSEGHEVTAIDNYDDYYTTKLRNLDDVKNNEQYSMQFEEKRLDITDNEDMKEIKKLMDDVDVVFHLAAQAGVRISVRDPFKSHRINATGTLNLLVAAKDSNVERFIYASSSSVYGKSPTLPLKEDGILMPVSPYGVTKLAAEKYANAFWDVYGLKTISLRYFTVFGPRQRPDMAIRIFVDRILQNKAPKIFGDGEQSRDFTYISDIVEANMLSLKAKKFGIALNTGSGKSITVNHLIETILKIMGKRDDIKPVYLSAQAGDARHTWADSSLAQEILGWRGEVSLEEGLRNFIKWYIPIADRIREVVK